MPYNSRYSPYAGAYAVVRNAARYSGGMGQMMSKPTFGIPQRFRYGQSSTRTMTKTRRIKSTGAGGTLKSAIRSMETAQHFSQNISLNFGSNAQYAFNPVGAIQLGNSDSTRTNDEIFIECLKINYSYQTASTVSGGQKLRFILLFADEDTTSTGAFVQNALTTGQVFVANTATANFADGITDPKKVTVLSDTTVCVNASFSGMQERECGAYTVQIKKPFVYKPASAYGKLRNLYMYVTGDAISQDGGALIGRLLMSYDLIFKNSK